MCVTPFSELVLETDCSSQLLHGWGIVTWIDLLVLKLTVQSSTWSVWQCQNCQEQQLKVINVFGTSFETANYSRWIFVVPSYVLQVSDNTCCLCWSWHHRVVVLVSLSKYNLTRMGGYLGQLYELTCLRGPVFARFHIPKETTTAFIIFVQHHQR